MLVAFPVFVYADRSVVLQSASAIPVGQIASDVVAAAQSSAWIIMPDYSFTQLQAYGQYHASASKCRGVAAAVTDSYAATYLMGHLANSQNQILDTNPSYISQSDCGSPTGIPGSDSIVVIAGPGVNEVNSYYSVTNQSLLYYNFKDNCIDRRDTGKDVACDTSTPTQDLLAVEAFQDSLGHHVYLLWGKSYLGTLAAVSFVVEFVAKNPNAYADSWYVVKWNDASAGPSANGIPDAGDTYTMAPKVIASAPPLLSYASVAWQYFRLGVGINPHTLLPRGWVTGTIFDFWDVGMTIDAAIAAYRTGVITQSEYQHRINALLSFLENMQLNTDGTAYYAYAWDTGAPAITSPFDGADGGRTLNALAYLRRFDQSYATRINTMLTGRLRAWMNALSTIGTESTSVYARDLELGVHQFRDLNSGYNRSTWLTNFYNAWVSPDRIIDAYGNSMPKMDEANLGPVTVELLEHGDDYNHTLQYAQDMMNWASTRDKATNKDGLWGTEIHALLSDGSTPCDGQFFVAYVPNQGYNTWQVRIINSTTTTWYNETSPGLSSAGSSVDAAYTLKAIFTNNNWINSVFTRYTQTDLQSSNGYFEAFFEVGGGHDPTISLHHNAVVLLAAAIGQN